jgi:uncharacterized protein
VTQRPEAHPPVSPSAAARELIAGLGLRVHPEGGYYREIYRSRDRVQRDGAEHGALTSIYFLLAAGQHSRWHVVGLDEVWHFLAGDPLELITYEPGQPAAERVLLGPLAGPGEPFAAVPRDIWQAARPTGDYSLVGCTVAPGFEFTHFRFVADLAGHEAAFAGPLASYAPML